VLASNFDGKLVSYTEEFRKSFSFDQWVFPIDITTLQLDIPVPTRLNSHVLFLMDAEDIFDIVDYWNLRAAGFRVFPLPTSHYQDFAESTKLFAERSVYRINRNISTKAEMIKARSVDETQWEAAGKWFASLGVNAERLTMRGWVPRFRPRERDRRVSHEIEIRSPISMEASEVVVFNDGHGSLKVHPPDCELTGRYFSQHWAVDFQSLGAPSEDGTFRLPWLHAECDALVNRKIGHRYGAFASRVTRHGIVLLQRSERANAWVQEPKVTEVLQAYLKDGGFTYLKTSTPGLTLEHIVEQLGGLSSAEEVLNEAMARTPTFDAEKSKVKTELDKRMRECASAIEESRRSLELWRDSYWKDVFFALPEERMKWSVYFDDKNQLQTIAPDELAEWEKIFNNAIYPKNLVKQIDLDTRFQLRVAVILRHYLRKDFDISLRTISRLTVLTYICGGLCVEDEENIILDVDGKERTLKLLVESTKNCVPLE
jgi:hypothetical protein